MGLSSRLKNRIDVYGKIKSINELNEVDFEYGKIKTIWAEIIQQSGSEKTGKGNTIYAEVSHKFTIRSNSLSEITNDMYFIFKGQKYDIKYFNPNYKYNDSIDIYCKLVVEE